MHAEQRIAAQIVIKRDVVQPRTLCVARLAGAPELSGVRIVNGVAFAAGAGDLFHRLVLVAARAGEPFVAIDQRKARVGVHEIDVSPLRRLVALVALCAVAALMFVVIAVARGASGIKVVLKVLPPMAVTTAKSRVTVQQCESRSRVIEADTAPAVR